MNEFCKKLVLFIKYATGIAILIILLKVIELLFTLELVHSEYIKLQYSDVFNLMLILLTFVIIVLTVLIAVVSVAAFVGWQSVQRQIDEGVARAAGAWMERQTDKEKVPSESKTNDSDEEDT